MVRETGMGIQENTSSHRVLSVFMLAMINIAMIASLRGLPTMAEYGLSSIFYYVLAALVFLVPTSLVSAELATGWPQEGGVFLWVSEALGPRWGFLAIWLQWIQNVIWYPTVLSFAAATISYTIDPTLANNKLYTVCVIMTVYWGATLANFRGMKLSGWISSVGVILGTLAPAGFIIVLGMVWLVSGDPSQVTMSARSAIPDLSHFSNVVFATGTIVFFAGVEVSAVHALEVKNPQRDYPRAIGIAAVVVLAVFVLGTLAISVVVPKEKISLVAGLMQAFSVFLDTFHLVWLVPIIAVCISFGVFGQLTTWIAGPSKGLLAVARKGYLPPFFQHVNNSGVQTHILVVQALIVSALGLAFLLMPTVSSSYWILTALTVQLYLSMYILMFISAIVLRYKRPDVARPYRIPGGNLGMWIVAGLGILGGLAALVLGYVPPAQLDTGSPITYVAFLVIGALVLCALPLTVYELRANSWKPDAERAS
jgi:putative glutamate/gamma-aminobutyrate antiporter